MVVDYSRCSQYTKQEVGEPLLRGQKSASYSLLCHYIRVRMCGPGGFQYPIHIHLFLLPTLADVFLLKIGPRESRERRPPSLCLVIETSRLGNRLHVDNFYIS